MSVTWTKEQQQIIDLRDRNILVSAAAGSGKTAVLVERIIAMLMDESHPMDVDRLLVVTFTEAAAAEMKERVRNAIEKRIPDSPDNEHLKRQATLIHSAQITTIHSFCLSVIRDHFHVIDVNPGFRIGEEGELKLLRHDVMDRVMEERYQEGSKEFLDFVDGYGGARDDQKIGELVLKLYEYSRSYPDPEHWLSTCVDAYRVTGEEELEKSPYMGLVRKRTRQVAKDAKEVLAEAIAICWEPDGPRVYEEALQADLLMADALIQAKNYREMYEAAQSVSWVNLRPNRGKQGSEEKASLVKALREEAKGMIKGLSGQYFYQGIEEVIRDMALGEPAMEMLASLVLQLSAQYEEYKLSQNMIDFGDMEQYALRILTEKRDGTLMPSPTAREYQQKYVEIMIDEYQDSNLIQEEILNSVSTVSTGRNNIFMVGDVKQSIYRFRLSRPELFMEKYYTYQTKDSACQRIDLHKNFRSRQEVLASVNGIFEQIMTEPLGGIPYDEKAALYVGADYEDCKKKGANRTEVLVIPSDLSAYEEGAEVSERELEARVIGMRIRELMDTYMVRDKRTGKSRRARYSDMVILTRSAKGFSDVFGEVLNREGIPTYAGSREGYFETQEIGVLLDYLRILNNSRQDIPLAAVLTSCMCGLGQQELALAAGFRKDLPFHEAVFAYAREGTEESIRKKLCRCFAQIETFRKMVPYTPMHELLLRIIEDTGYGSYTAALPGGEQRKANLEMLIEKARDFESTSYKGLFHFIRYVEQLQKYKVDYGEASLEDEQSDTVRMMTIHKSKGLEFPIVFVAGMGKRFNMQDAKSSVILHSRLGVGLDAVDLVQRTKSPGLPKKVIQREEVLDSLGEELRVLYVAMTRAKEKLILTGTVKNMEKAQSVCEMAARQTKRQFSFSQLSKAVTYWDWILPAIAKASKDIPLDVRTITAEQLVGEEMTEIVGERFARKYLENWDTDVVYNERMKEAIQEQFSYQYPYGDRRDQKLKFTVSELKKRNTTEEEAGDILYKEEEVIPLIPQFLKEEEKLTGALRGTAYHRVMELLDFAADYDAPILTAELASLCEEGRLDTDMAQCIRIPEILAFLHSGVGQRMREAAVKGSLRKEQPFVFGVSAREMYPDETEEELILVQGIIDAYFEEDGLVVLDYKTDRVKTAEELKEKYHAQLDYYARALEQVTGKAVKEKIIYSFALEKEIEV